MGAVAGILTISISCRAKYLEPGDKSTGTKLRNGSWNGVIGMLQNDDVDVSNAYLIMAAEREEAVDFTTPVLSTRYMCTYLLFI
jgi:hypothetical protein